MSSINILDMDEPLMLKAKHKQNYAISIHQRDCDFQESNIAEIKCFKYCSLRELLFILISLLTFGFFTLLSYWLPYLHAKVRYETSDAPNSEYLLITNQDLSQEIVKVKLKTLDSSTEISGKQMQGTLRTFKYRFLRFYYDSDLLSFQPIFYETQKSFKKHLSAKELSKQIVQSYQMMYGKCHIKIRIPSIPNLLKKEILHPFYIFQICAVILWAFDEYVLYASCIFLMSAGSCFVNLYETRRNLKDLQQMALQNTQVQAMRENSWNQVSSQQLVPGDLVRIDETKVPCDMIVLQGQIIVDESTLTGESCPVVKDCIPNTDQIYRIDTYKQNTLFEGTQVIQTRGETLGLVLRTGFSTSKGKLIRGIMYPKPNNFKFYEDSFKFIGVLFALALIGFIIIVPLSVEQGVESRDVFFRSLDLITVTVPPALPMAMTIGTAFAIARLKQQRITCISPPRVNVAGKIDLMVFDKTGTLTQEGMNIMGVRAVNQNKSFEDKIQAVKEINLQLENTDFIKDQKSQTPNLQLKFIECLACCHSLNNVRGELIGDRLEQQMFESTGWRYIPSLFQDIKGSIVPVINGQPCSETIQILRIFHFNSNLKRMGVITKSTANQSQFNFFQKGALECVASNCIENSLPENLKSVHNSYTQAGYRVLALAYKQMQNVADIESIQLEEIEKSLTFLGLIIFQNALKPETFQEIQNLHHAKLRTIIATGDDVYTAVSVARECFVIPAFSEVHIGDLDKNDQIQWKVNLNDKVSQDQNQKNIQEINPFSKFQQQEQKEEVTKGIGWFLNYQKLTEQENTISLAITGNAFVQLIKLADEESSFRVMLDLVLQKGQIFARMAPEHKTLLIELLQRRKLLVGMCGDGANDCGALKQADIGISLSQAEASIAAPFTSRVQNIQCTSTVLREGRCALTTSFECFKYMALYSMIQFTTVTILYSIVSNLGDSQFLWIDLCHIIPLAIFMGYQGPYHQLVSEQPTGALVSVPVLASIAGQIIIQLLFQILMIFYVLPKQSWFQPLKPDLEEVDENYLCYENTALFLLSCFQYLLVAVVFSTGAPFRQASYKNYMFMVAISILLLLDLYLLFAPSQWTLEFMELMDIPLDFKCLIALAAGLNFIIAMFYEKIGIKTIGKCFT